MTNTHVSRTARTPPVAQWSRGPAPAGPRAAAAGSIATVASRAGTAALCTALVVAVLAPDALDRVAAGVALTGIVLGIPHGAVDHMVPFWAAGVRPGPRELAAGLAGYVLVAALAATALIRYPTPMAALFLVVSALHFGRGEVTFAAERAGRPAPDRRTDLGTTLTHGAVVVLLPLTLWHDRAAPVLGALGPGLAQPLPRAGLLLVAAATACATLVVAARRASQRRPREAVELVLLLAVFLVVPPLVAFGVYFGAWHAVRHTGRLLTLPGPHGPLTPRAALVRYLQHAAAPTVVACAALIVADRLVGTAAVPVALAVLLALTFPHLRVVARWDRARSAGSYGRG